jgi:hypothetical protein
MVKEKFLVTLNPMVFQETGSKAAEKKRELDHSMGSKKDATKSDNGQGDGNADDFNEDDDDADGEDLEGYEDEDEGSTHSSDDIQSLRCSHLSFKLLRLLGYLFMIGTVPYYM